MAILRNPISGDDPDDDGIPYCDWCGAETTRECHCTEISDNRPPDDAEPCVTSEDDPDEF